jgi:hypothetical protein
MRLKFVQIAMLQDKAFATKRPKMRDGQLASQTKLQGDEIQDPAQENSIGDITCSADSIGSKASGVLCLLSIILAISTIVRFFHSTTPLY